MKNSPLSPLSPASLSTSLLKSLRTPATENPWTSGWQVWSLPHAYTNERQAHCFLSLYSHYNVRSPLRLLPFLSRQHQAPCPAKCWLWNRLSEAVLEPHDGEAKYFIRRFAALHRPTTQEVLRDPWHTTHQHWHQHHWHPVRYPTLIYPPHWDKNWSPRANWHSAFDRYKASLDAIMSRSDILVMEWHWVVLETPFAGAFASDIYL